MSNYRSSIITCREKIRFSTDKSAGKKARRQSTKFGYPMYVYYCSMCLGYHTTKTPPLIITAV